MKTFTLKISSPNGDVFFGEAVKLCVRGTEGELAILAGHIPFVSSVVSCDCKIEPEDGTEKIGHTNGGVLTVTNELVLLLSGDFSFTDQT